MTGPPADEPDLDPEILEELEFWTGPDDPAGDGAPAGGDEVPGGPGPAPGGSHPPGSDPVGSLVVVGTPIGNLGDLSPRAVQSLAQADILYCEDTRHSRKLLSHAGLTGIPLRSLHEHNEAERQDEVVGAVRSGATVALVSDAGMPGISDPGAAVVRAVAEAGLVVTVVPGPSAVLTALVASGLPTDRFCFEGFLPRSGRERRTALAGVAAETRTTVLFEAPGRVAATLADLAAVCGGERPVSVSRELTKVHEEHWRGTLADSADWTAHPVRGEVVLVLGGAPDIPAEAVGDDVLVAALHERLDAGERTRGVVDDLASTFGVPRRRVYELALAVREPARPGVEEEGRNGPGG
ncbi:MAG: 16S rRNA (cytidine(1402)-2'-O)-methyltransferase [Acidimicrobiales bacterium]|jgi:16S rRNA (cytidine1402-2'-O)-methyltransferase